MHNFTLKKFLKRFLKFLKRFNNNLETYKVLLRVIEIEQDEHEEYVVNIQVVNKRISFKTTPEKILKDNSLVEKFSPTDIRTLTYLGYLDINSPKYKILAKYLSENDDKILFAIRKKGEINPIIKSADEITKCKDILNNLNQDDAHTVGFINANEQDSSLRKEILIAVENKSNTLNYNNNKSF